MRMLTSNEIDTTICVIISILTIDMFVYMKNNNPLITEIIIVVKSSGKNPDISS